MPSAPLRISTVDVVLWLLPPAITTLHAILSPHTKVEESFTLHALHDLLYRGFRPTVEWDHVEFPGPLPRTFIPAILLSFVVKPVLWMARQAIGILSTVDQQQAPASGQELDRFLVQVLGRVVLGLLSSASLLYISRQVRKRHGLTAQRLYLLLSVTQFHLMYYASRTLPNFMALPFVNVAFGLILSPGRGVAQPKHQRDGRALAIMAATATIVRSEIACLLGPLALALLVKRRLSLAQTVGWGALGGVCGTALTVAVDSSFWGYWTWPEAYGVWFNVVRNESAKQWGTSPWWYYIKHLPLLLLAAGPFVLLAGLVQSVRRRVSWIVGVLPAVAMIGAMSTLGHKEWRFIAYVVPWLNVPAAVFATQLWQVMPGSSSAFLRPLSRTLVLCALAANMAAASSLLLISMGNYPGGDIMRGPMREELQRFDGRPVHLYSPPLPLQTGSSLFLVDPHARAGHSTTFNKTEFADPITPDFALAQAAWTHVILPSGTDDEIALWTAEGSGWDEVGRASGFGGFDLQRGRPSKTLGLSHGPWLVLDASSSLGAGWGANGATIHIREGERCVLVRRQGLRI